MPATAGRVRMPANNRVHSSAALQTHGIWQSAIGYDPYAPDQKQAPPASGDRDPQASLAAPSADQQNTYDSFQGLLALARLTGSNADEARGACRRCGRVGHLPFQCRNFLKDESALLASATAAASNIPGHLDGSSQRKDRTHDKGGYNGQVASSSSSEEDEISDSDNSGLSDSSADSEMERAIAAKFGKNILKNLSKKSKPMHSKDRSSRRRSHSKRSKSKREDESDEKHENKLKHRSKRSRSSESDLGSDESSEDERRSKRRRHSHKHGRSKSKQHTRRADDSSEPKRGRHSKKRKSSHRHRRDNESG